MFVRVLILMLEDLGDVFFLLWGFDCICICFFGFGMLLFKWLCVGDRIKWFLVMIVGWLLFWDVFVYLWFVL